MKTSGVRVGSERELVGAVGASTSGFWFAGYYYASPAMLVERGFRMTI